jgi:hypothetical protein
VNESIVQCFSLVDDLIPIELMMSTLSAKKFEKCLFEYYYFLGGNAVQLGKISPRFRRNVLPIFSGSKSKANR